MKYTCTKTVKINERDTSDLIQEVFSLGLEYDCVYGFLTDNIGIKRAISHPKFKEHFAIKCQCCEQINPVTCNNEKNGYCLIKNNFTYPKHLL